jgi:DNA repair protein RadC
MILNLRKSSINKIMSPDDVFNLIAPYMRSRQKADRDKEWFFVIALRSNNSIVYVDAISIGNLKATIAEAREIFRNAIKYGGVNAIILCHNHPSGNTNPSESDRKITDQLVSGGKLLGIEVVDHVIITTDSFYSFKNEDEI